MIESWYPSSLSILLLVNRFNSNAGYHISPSRFVFLLFIMMCYDTDGRRLVWNPIWFLLHISNQNKISAVPDATTRYYLSNGEYDVVVNWKVFFRLACNVKDTFNVMVNLHKSRARKSDLMWGFPFLFCICGGWICFIVVHYQRHSLAAIILFVPSSYERASDSFSRISPPMDVQWTTIIPLQLFPFIFIDLNAEHRLIVQSIGSKLASFS